MWGELQKSIKKNWRLLSVLAGVTLVLFASALWWKGTREQEPAQPPAGETVQVKQPLPDTELGRRMGDMLDKGDYQRTLPEAPKQETRKSTPMPRWLANAILYTLVGLGIFSIAVMIWILVTGSTSGKVRSRKPRKPAARTEAQIAGSHALAQPASLEEAQAEAKAGNFGEAVRMLLATALINLAKQELVRLRPWMTGREIVRDAKLAATPADALFQLVATVEAYAFAGQDITEDAYRTCFQHFQLLNRSGKGAV